MKEIMLSMQKSGKIKIRKEIQKALSNWESKTVCWKLL